MDKYYFLRIATFTLMFLLLLALYLIDDKKNRDKDPMLHKATMMVILGMVLVFSGFILMLLNQNAFIVALLVVPGGYIWAKNDKKRRSSKLSFDSDKRLVAKRKHEEKVAKKLSKKNTNLINAEKERQDAALDKQQRAIEKELKENK